MKNIIVYASPKEFSDYLPFLRIEEYKANLCIVGIILNSPVSYKMINGYECLVESDLKLLYWDYILFAGSKETKKEFINEQSIASHKVIDMKVLRLPAFDFEDYLNLLENKITIISNTCWGGITYHSLGMEFYSPFINMFVKDEDYITLLKDLDKKMQCELKFEKMQFDVNIKRDYPVGNLDGVLLHFNHYVTFEKAKEAWDRRKLRMNYNNIFVEAKIENLDMAQEFEKLDFVKKIGFSPIEFNIPSVQCVYLYQNIYVKKKMKNKFWKIITDMSMVESEFVYYDVISLLNGKEKIWRYEI